MRRMLILGPFILAVAMISLGSTSLVAQRGPGGPGGAYLSCGGGLSRIA